MKRIVFSFLVAKTEATGRVHFHEGAQQADGKTTG